MADVKWIKLSVGLPGSRKLKQIRRLPEGDSIALLWVFLLCLAGEVNEDGLIYFTPEIPYTDEMLAEEFNMDVNIIRIGLKTFQNFGMLEIVDDIIRLDSWEKWQSTDRLAELREYNRLAKQRSRAKQKALPDVNDKSMTSQRCQGTDIDKEEDKEEEKDKNIDLYINIINHLNQKAGTNYKASTKKTKSCIHARFDEGFTEDDFITVIDKKCAEWLGTEWEKFLRPETLFGTKFESYLNAKVTPKAKTNGFETPKNSTDEFMDKLQALYEADE